MKKPKDKWGWAKAAAWVVGGAAFVAFAVYDVCTRGWAGAGEVAAICGAVIWARACLHVADQYFNPKLPPSSQDIGTTAAPPEHNIN